MLDKKNSKKIITALLVLSCAVSGVILSASSPYKNYQLENGQQLDSLILISLQDARIQPAQLQVWNVPVDTIFTRKEYRVEVPSRFSKTLFHLDLHHSLNRFDMEAPAKVHFPSRDMDIYVYSNETVLRSIRLTTNPELDSLYITEEN
jgi:hypothetical protein